MTTTEEHLENLTEIRSIMERSTRFISLSGLSGVSAGIMALLGSAYAFMKLNIQPLQLDSYYRGTGQAKISTISLDLALQFVLVGLLVLTASLVFGYLFTLRNTRRHGQSMWGRSSKQMVGALAVPLVVGGLFCSVLIYHSAYGLVAPATLIFYGLALVNAGKFTLKDINYLGLSEIALGLVATFFLGYSLLFWAIGFGVLHIIYGISMYVRYER